MNHPRPQPGESSVQRIVGRHRGPEPGPTLLCVAGIHGNEPSGLQALRRVFAALADRRPPFRGELAGLAGNLRALAQGSRYVDRDLNRQWRPDRIAPVRAGDPGSKPAAEDVELRELQATLDRIVAERRGPVSFLDLHTTSSRSAPFAVISDTLRNRAFARRFPVPVILGLEEQIDGSIADYLDGLGCITMGFEAGQHDDPRSVDLHEAVIWIALEAAGLLSSAALPEARRSRRSLLAATDGLPPFLEIIHSHPVVDEDSFRMLPGFENFQPVQAGQPLARDARGLIRAGRSALLFMPLYQDLGDFGFYAARPVRPFWLKVSTVLRRLRLSRVAHWLPGVRRHPGLPHAVTVQPRVARWFVTPVFHLLGFRRRPSEGDRLVFVRRDRQT